MTNPFLTRQVPFDQPRGPTLPAIPDLDGTEAGTQNTVQALVQVVRHLAGQTTAPNNVTPPPQGARRAQNNASKFPPPNPKIPPKQDEAQWVEVARTTEKVKISNPNDDTQFVIVKQITKLVFQNVVTKQQLVWTL